MQGQGRRRNKMATGDTRENKDIPPGTKVNCITCFDEKIEGEVLAFDYNSKFIVIKSNKATSKEPTDHNCDVKMLNTSYLKDMRIVEMATSPQAPLPPLDVSKIDKRVRAARIGKQEAVDKIGVGVSNKAQKLFDTINRTFNEIKWHGQCIVVMDDVTVRPPYKAENCFCTGTNSKALEHIQKLVRKYNEDEAKVTVGKC